MDFSREPPFDAIWERLSRLPAKQHRFAEALLANPELVAFGSIREVGGRIGVNNATIVRFAQSFGFGGYGGLQAAVRRAYLQRAGLPAPHDPQNALSDASSALAATQSQQRANLDAACANVNPAKLAAIADALEGAREIVVCAESTAVGAGLLLVRLLPYVGLRGSLVDPASVEGALALERLGAGDVLVAIGLWLTFRATVDAIAAARERGVTSVAISGTATSPLGREAQHVIVAPAQGGAVSFSLVAAVAVVEMLIADIAGRRSEIALAAETKIHDTFVRHDALAPLDRRRTDQASAKPR
jgi:DNA-binding MurR/RpiR family transcriptional regulator